MATRALQLRKGTTAEHATFTGLNAEVTVDTTKHTVVVNDGVSAGGHPLAKESEVPKITSTTGSVKVPSGSTSQRDSVPSNGLFRYNSETKNFEGYVDGSWIAIGTYNSPVVTTSSLSSDFLLPVAKGGTNATTAADARTSLGVPSTSGTGATGTWGISISGNANTATTATSATSATNATNASNSDTLDGYHASSFLQSVPGATESTLGGLKVSLSGTTLTITNS